MKGTIGRNLVQQHNYEIVAGSPAREVDLEKESLCGYIYEQDGGYTKHYLQAGVEEVAKFICSSEKDKLLCNSDDYL